MTMVPCTQHGSQARPGRDFIEPLIFERGAPGRCAASLPSPGVPVQSAKELLPEGLRRSEPPLLPEVSELAVVRHFTRLSQLNHSVDTGFYPLGSCTMKYNPRVNEALAALPGFMDLHPLQPAETIQGALGLIYHLEHLLAELSGFVRVTLQPSAGAHGELAGLMMIRKALQQRGDERQTILVPESAHGTNPASAALNGFGIRKVPCDSHGLCPPAEVARLMGAGVAAIMITNPSTVGIFEEGISEIVSLVHERGAFVYCDGANLNAILGRSRPGDWGVDVMQFNLHKTFSTPHGGGGPGSGPVGVAPSLEPFLPVPTVERDDAGVFRLDHDRPLSIGRLRSFVGNFGVMVRAYAYLREMGPEGLRRVAELAVLNARYLLSLLEREYHRPLDRPCMHEFIINDQHLEGCGVKTLDVAKRLLDYGYHAPTIYFPLVVPAAMMIEPTESESPEELELFARAMLHIAREAREQPELLRDAPHLAPVGRLDEARAARRPRLRWTP